MISIGISLILLFNLALSDVWNSRDYLKKEYSLVKPYNNDGKWILVGSAVTTKSYIRLTPDQQSRKGALWNDVPCRMANWELHVHFRVFGSGTNMFGDGFALWYARDRAELGPVFGSKDYFYGLGLFFDTYGNHDEKHNHGFPYISAMVNNGSLHYDHDQDGTYTQLAGCELQFRGLQTETHIIIRYENQKLTVSHDIEGKNVWKLCFSVNKVMLPTGLYFGASAATGGLSDNHDIISVKVYDIGHAKDTDADLSNIVPSAEVNVSAKLSSSEKSESSDSESGWSVLLWIVVLVLGLGVGIVLFSMYGRRPHKKRLY